MNVFELFRNGKRTHSFRLKSLHNRESPGVMDVLHYEPVDGLSVLAIDTSCFDKLGLEARN